MKRREALQRTGLLAGSLAVTPALIGLLQSCQKQERLSWKPVVLDEDQARFVSAMVDTILPTTETPGALDVNVDVFIDKVYATLYPAEGQQEVKEEISTLQNRCKEAYGDMFSDLSDDDKKSFLTDLEEESGNFGGRVWGTPVGDQQPVGFYRSFKSLALWGYFTSEKIGKDVLTYDPIPGAYLGCIPLSDVGNQYSL